MPKLNKTQKEILHAQNVEHSKQPCIMCSGTGIEQSTYKSTDPCGSCNGTGKTTCTIDSYNTLKGLKDKK